MCGVDTSRANAARWGKVEIASMDGNPSYAADWLGVMRLCITVYTVLLRFDFYPDSATFPNQYKPKRPVMLVTDLTNPNGKCKKCYKH